VAREYFRWTQGEERVAHFESTPGRKKRFFCPRCGTHLIAAWNDAPDVIVRVGSLDADPGIRPVAHIWISHKAPWFEITDVLAQHTEGPTPASAPRQSET
jgi:hypothetical protein